MAYKRNLLTLLLLTLVLTACLRGGHGAGKVLEQQDSVITHARLLSMQREAGYTLVTVADPWKGGELHRYVLVPSDSVLPDEDAAPFHSLLQAPLGLPTIRVSYLFCFNVYYL